MADTAWVPFSSRYGLRKGTDAWAFEHWTARHSDHGVVSFVGCPPDPRKVCACPGGSSASRKCCDVATAEDLLCDACREHCWAVDNQRRYHRFIDLYGPLARDPSQPPADPRSADEGG